MILSNCAICDTRLLGRLRLFSLGCEAGDAGHEFVQEARHVDADGNLHFQLPWAKQAEEPIQPPETPDVEIQDAEYSLSNALYLLN